MQVVKLPWSCCIIPTIPISYCKSDALSLKIGIKMLNQTVHRQDFLCMWLHMLAESVQQSRPSGRLFLCPSWPSGTASLTIITRSMTGTNGNTCQQNANFLPSLHSSPWVNDIPHWNSYCWLAEKCQESHVSATSVRFFVGSMYCLVSVVFQIDIK